MSHGVRDKLASDLATLIVERLPVDADERALAALADDIRETVRARVQLARKLAALQAARGGERP